MTDVTLARQKERMSAPLWEIKEVSGKDPVLVGSMRWSDFGGGSGRGLALGTWARGTDDRSMRQTVSGNGFLGEAGKDLTLAPAARRWDPSVAVLREKRYGKIGESRQGKFLEGRIPRGEIM